MKTYKGAGVIGIKYNIKATIRDAVTNKVKRVYNFKNLLPTVGRTAIANNLANTSPTPPSVLVNYCAVGTNATAAANGDVQLGTEVARNTIASRTNSSNIAYITGFFAATEAVATLREVGFFINGTATVNSGTLLSRVIINITKSGTETLTLDLTLTIS